MTYRHQNSRKSNFATEPARFIKTISVAELKALDLQDVVVERPVLEMMQHANHRRSIRVINGLKPGNLTRVLQGEDVGTLIYAD